MSDATGNPVPGAEETPAPDPTTDVPIDSTSSTDPAVPTTSTEDPTPEETPSESPIESTSSTTEVPPAETTTSSTPPAEESPVETSTPVEEESPTSTPEEESPTTSEEVVPTTSSPAAETTTSAERTTSQEPDRTTITIPATTSDNGQVRTTVVVITSTREQPSETTSAPTTTSAAPGTIDPSGDSSDNGLNKGAKVAIGVVVPIVAIAIIAIVALFWWKKRRARQEAEEERRKEVEDYSYNPNADPTIPPVGMAENSYEMREDGSSGYRGWGTTTVGSTGRKASTTMSGGVAAGAYSDVTTSPGRGGGSEARSGEPLMDGEILGAMGPSAANNRNGDVRRGPSNASSSYSAANRSDNSDGMGGMAYSDGGFDQYGQTNPYVDNGYGGAQEMSGQPIIRDNPARRNTRIENPAHFPQQSAGISQNF